jgi:hypothetical protein
VNTHYKEWRVQRRQCKGRRETETARINGQVKEIEKTIMRKQQK